MFDPCVDKTLGLIEGQLRQVAINGSKAKVTNLFLLGVSDADGSGSLSF